MSLASTLSQVKHSSQDARPHQEDQRARPGPLPMAGGEEGAEGQAPREALRREEVLLGCQQGRRGRLPGGSRREGHDGG